MGELKSEKDATEYIGKVEKALIYLAELSKDAGLYSHASFFHTVIGSFMGGVDEFEILRDLVYKYNEDVMRRMDFMP